MVLTLCGVGLSLQGWTLAFLGGSPYYLGAGLLLIAVALLLFRGKPEGAKLYGAFLGATYLWALFEVGLDPWQLMPRVGLFTVLGLWFLLPESDGVCCSESLMPYYSCRLPVPSSPPWQFWLLPCSPPIADTRSRYPLQRAPGRSSMTQASGDIMGQASAAHALPPPHRSTPPTWTTGACMDYQNRRTGEFKGTPIQIDDGLYLCTGRNVILALDPDSGEERWRYDPGNPVCANRVLGHLPWRHLLCQPARAGGQQLSERIITATTDARLIAVSKETGETCSDFGDEGEVNLLTGMGEIKPVTIL